MGCRTSNIATDGMSHYTSGHVGNLFKGEVEAHFKLQNIGRENEKKSKLKYLDSGLAGYAYGTSHEHSI